MPCIECIADNRIICISEIGSSIWSEDDFIVAKSLSNFSPQLQTICTNVNGQLSCILINTLQQYVDTWTIYRGDYDCLQVIPLISTRLRTDGRSDSPDPFTVQPWTAILMRLETVNLNYTDYKLILVSTTFIESTALGVRIISCSVKFLSIIS